MLYGRSPFVPPNTSRNARFGWSQGAYHTPPFFVRPNENSCGGPLRSLLEGSRGLPRFFGPSDNSCRVTPVGPLFAPTIRVRMLVVGGPRGFTPPSFICDHLKILVVVPRGVPFEAPRGFAHPGFFGPSENYGRPTPRFFVASQIFLGCPLWTPQYES